MSHPIRARCTLATAVALLLPLGGGAQTPQPESKKPELTVRVTPPMGFTPLRVRTTAEARGGSDDYEEFYCASVEWEWGDGTMSESTIDCDPYQAGKSTIQRRFTADHVYRQGGSFRIVFRLKQKARTVASSMATVQVRSGAGEGFDRW